MAYKQKGWSPFTKESPLKMNGHPATITTGPKSGGATTVGGILREEANIQARKERMAKGFEKKAARKERKAEKKYEKGRTRAGDRKTRKAKRLRESASALKKVDDKKVPRVPTKSPHDVIQMLEKKKANGTITATELKRLNAIKTKMETGPGSYGNEQWDKE